MDSDATREVHLPHQMAPQPPSPKHIHLYVNKYTSHKGAHQQQLFGTHQVDTNVDQRSQVREEGNDWLPMKCQTNPFNQTASCLPLHLPPENNTQRYSSHTLLKAGHQHGIIQYVFCHQSLNYRAPKVEFSRKTKICLCIRKLIDYRSKVLNNSD